MTVTLLAVVLGVVTIPLHALVLRRPPVEPEVAPGAAARATPAA